MESKEPGFSDDNVGDTLYRLFTAYADPAAGELGTIYQACNFYYLGQQFGGKYQYISPHTGRLVSDRYFRQKTAYRRFAKELGIDWNPSWQTNTGMVWENVPSEVADELRNFSRRCMESCDRVEPPKKHKYAYILGRSKAETFNLRGRFLGLNKVFSYPTERGT